MRRRRVVRVTTIAYFGANLFERPLGITFYLHIDILAGRGISIGGEFQAQPFT